MLVRISKVLGSDWLRSDSVRVGGVPATAAAADRYVTVADGEKLLLRVDVYSYGPDCFAFEDAIVWRNSVIVGFGSHVHAISLPSRSVATVPLESYFGHLYPAADYLLIASGTRLSRMEPDCSILWTSEELAVDGVVVHDPGPPIVRGDGEWDPPGGWQPFSVLAANGRRFPATT